MKLALAMGRPDVDRFAEELTAREFREWQSFWQLEPFGDDWRMSARAAILVARSFGAKIDANTEDMFFPGFDPFEQKQTPEEMRAAFERIKTKCQHPPVSPRNSTPTQKISPRVFRP